MSSRSAQMVAISLTILLIVLVGATAVVLVSRPVPTVSDAPATATQTPTAATTIAVASPTASAFPALSASPASSTPPTPTPTDVPVTGAPASAVASMSAAPSAAATVAPALSPSASPTAEPTAPSGASPTAEATLEPSAPQRELQLLNLGVDSPAADTSVERAVAFVVDGPGEVSAAITDASASAVTLCLYPENEPEINDDDCDRGGDATIERASVEAAQSRWVATVIGNQAAVSPFVTLTLRFNAEVGNVTLRNMRYAGTSAPEYNGFEAIVLTVAEGPLTVDADFEGGAHRHHLRIQRVDSGEPVYDVAPSEPSDRIHVSVPNAEPAAAYSVMLRSPEEFVANGEVAVFATATIVWP